MLIVLRGIYMLIFCLTFIDDFEDKKLFENLFNTYRKQMFYLAMSIIHSKDDAEDIVHDVFLNIAQRQMSVIKAIKNDEDMRNYLLKATKNKALNRIRDRKKDNVCIDSIIEFSNVNITDSEFIDKICDESEYEHVLTAIESLDSIYRNSLYYHFVLEIPIQEVSKILNQSISTTKKQLVRGKKRLLALLETKGE